MKQKAHLLVAADEEEITDLIDWADEHPTTDQLYQEQIPIHTRYRVKDWLSKILEADKDSYPVYTPVPADLADFLDLLIADWIEVLTSHDEVFHSYLVESEG